MSEIVGRTTWLPTRVVYNYADVVQALSDETPLLLALRMIIGILDDRALAEVLSEPERGRRGDPTEARSVITRRLDQLDHQAQGDGVQRAVWGDVKGVVLPNADLVNAVRIVLNIASIPANALDPKHREPLMTVMYSKDNLEDRDRLERAGLAAKAMVDRARAVELTAKARDNVDEHVEVDRLRHLAGIRRIS